MKIAICLSGHFRSYERCFETLNNTILKNYNPDIFIFTWDNLGFDGVRGDYNLGNINKHLDKINKLYNPKTICIEPMKKWNTHKYNKIGSGLRNPEILFGMFYGIYKSNELRKNYENINKFKYDIVIRCRPDIYFENNITNEELLNCKDGIMFPKFGNYSGLNDQFCFGDSDSMDAYAELYNNLDKHFDSGCLWHAETMVKYNIDAYKIPIYRTNIKFHLLRANGSIFRSACEPHLGDII